MTDSEITLEVLKGIRDEVRRTNERLDAVNGRLGATNGRLDGMGRSLRTEITELREDLGRRIVESELRTATAITELGGTVRDMTSVLRAQSDLRPRVEHCEREIDALKHRLGDG